MRGKSHYYNRNVVYCPVCEDGAVSKRNIMLNQLECDRCDYTIFDEQLYHYEEALRSAGNGRAMTELLEKILYDGLTEGKNSV